MFRMESCFLCLEPAKQTCEKCRNLSFCGEEHYSLHVNGEGCFPYRLDTKENVGRCMVASRNIEPGELIFREQAVAVGPFHDSTPVCLTCLKRVLGDFLCPSCNLPMCSQKCCDGVHSDMECAIFSEAKNKLTITNFEEVHPFYQCIAALRCLLLKERDEVKWKTLKLMMDHNPERRKDDHWNVCQHNIVHYLTNIWKLDFSPEEVNHVIGLIEVNAFEVKIGSLDMTDPIEECGTGRGVLPLLAMLSHSCISNSRYINQPGGWMECRATVPIREGDEIYDHYVTPVDDTQARVMALSHGWYFDCCCARCEDNTERGTFMSAYICQGLRERELYESIASLNSITEEQDTCMGMVLAINSMDFTTNYECDICGRIFENKTICRVKHEVEDVLEKTSKTDLTELENLLEVNRNTLYTSHSIMLAIKRHLIYIYGRTPEMCTGSLLMKKIEFCKELLKVYDVVVPGLTKERGLTMYELYVSSSQLGQGEDLLYLLKEAQKCLQYERKGTFEYEVRTKIKFMLQYLNDDLFENKND